MKLKLGMFNARVVLSEARLAELLRKWKVLVGTSLALVKLEAPCDTNKATCDTDSTSHETYINPAALATCHISALIKRCSITL